MRYLFLSVVVFIVFGCSSSVDEEKTEGDRIETADQEVTFIPTPKQFQAVWDAIMSDPERTLPQESVSYAKLFDGVRDLISEDAERTLSEHADIIGHFDKLAHPNGVCMKGLWQIDTQNPFGGYFRLGSEALVIARASSAMSNTKRGENRAFGMAIKLFATQDSLEVLTVNSANFFVIDDLGGTDAEYFSDVALTNAPDVSFTSSVFSAFAYGLKVASAFRNADENSGIRQVYEISYLGENNESRVLTPRWVKIEAEDNQAITGVEDFRDEFALALGEVIVFNISVSSTPEGETKIWQKIGNITFDASVVSNTCDHRLHFHHPKWRNDLVYE